MKDKSVGWTDHDLLVEVILGTGVNKTDLKGSRNIKPQQGKPFILIFDFDRRTSGMYHQ